jgi:phage-related protein
LEFDINLYYIYSTILDAIGYGKLSTPIILLAVVSTLVGVGLGFFMAFNSPLPNAGKGVMAIITIIATVLPFFLMPEYALFTTIGSVALGFINALIYVKSQVKK